MAMTTLWEQKEKKNSTLTTSGLGNLVGEKNKNAKETSRKANKNKNCI